MPLKRVFFLPTYKNDPFRGIFAGILDLRFTEVLEIAASGQ